MAQPCKIDNVNSNLDFETRMEIDRLDTLEIIATNQCGFFVEEIEEEDGDFRPH